MCIKWPNDIYYKDKVKLGGILVSCFTIPGQNTITAVIGTIYVMKISIILVSLK